MRHCRPRERHAPCLPIHSLIHPLDKEFLTMTVDRRWPLALSLFAAPSLALAQAQATVKPDGEFRYALGLGASYQSGNTNASSVNLSADGVRKTEQDK